TPEERAARDEARVKLRASLPALLADPWSALKVGAWFRVRTLVGKDETFTDSGLREKGKGYIMLGVQQQSGGRTEWERWERTGQRSTQLIGSEMLDLGGTPVECGGYKLV